MTRQRGLQLYIASICWVAVIIAFWCGVLAFQVPRAELLHWLPYVAFFVGLGLLCIRQQLYFSDSTLVTMATIAQVATLIVLPLPVAVLTAGMAKGLSQAHLHWKGRRTWQNAVFNTSNTILSNGAAGFAYSLCHGHELLRSQRPMLALLALLALVTLGTCYHLVNTILVTTVVTLNSGERLTSVFRMVFMETLLPEVSLIPVGIVFALLFRVSPVLSLLIVVPVYLSTRSFGAVERLRKETIEAVLKMAESIDYRDTGTSEHSERLAQYCGRLALAVGLTGEHAKEVVLASRVHDLGKIGISNSILLKQGSLTLQERQIMEDHPSIGASILASYSSFKHSSAIVRHHHERWDGKGYPDRLKGEAIPIGARIITVVDAYDAMVSDRPYRKSMSVSDAVDRLKDGMGTQFDPKICAAFIQMLIEDGTYIPAEPKPSLHLVEKEVG